MIEVLDQGLARRMIAIEDAATIFWPSGMVEPATSRTGRLVGSGRLSGPFWALFFGYVLHFPWTHTRSDSASGVFSQFGINNEFLKRLYDRIAEGTSSLVLFSNNDITNQLGALFDNLEFSCEILTTQIPSENAMRLWHVFGVPAIQNSIPLASAVVARETLVMHSSLP